MGHLDSRACLLDSFFHAMILNFYLTHNPDKKRIEVNIEIFDFKIDLWFLKLKILKYLVDQNAHANLL